MKGFKLIHLCLCLVLGGCVGFKASSPMRSIASVNASKQIMLSEVEDRLDHLHSYAIIGFNHHHATKHVVIQEQIALLEKDILNINKRMKNDKALVILLVESFARKSSTRAVAVKNLLQILGSNSNLKMARSFSKLELKKEIHGLEKSRHYQVFKQNIEHLAYMKDSKSDQTRTRL